MHYPNWESIRWYKENTRPNYHIINVHIWLLYALYQNVNSQEYEDLQSKYCHSLGLVFLLATASLAKCYLWLASLSSWGLNCSHSFITKAPVHWLREDCLQGVSSPGLINFLCSISWRPCEPKFSLVEFEEINTHMSDGFGFLWIVFYEELTLEICLSFGRLSSPCRFCHSSHLYYCSSKAYGLEAMLYMCTDTIKVKVGFFFLIFLLLVKVKP